MCKINNLKMELLTKVLEAQHKLDYELHVEFRVTGFTVTALACNTAITDTESVTIAFYEAFMHNGKDQEEKELNYAIAELSNMLRYGDLPERHRITLYEAMKPYCHEEYTEADLREYFNLEEDTDGLTKKVS